VQFPKSKWTLTSNSLGELSLRSIVNCQLVKVTYRSHVHGSGQILQKPLFSFRDSLRCSASLQSRQLCHYYVARHITEQVGSDCLRAAPVLLWFCSNLLFTFPQYGGTWFAIGGGSVCNGPFSCGLPDSKVPFVSRGNSGINGGNKCSFNTGLSPAMARAVPGIS